MSWSCAVFNDVKRSHSSGGTLGPTLDTSSQTQNFLTFKGFDVFQERSLDLLWCPLRGVRTDQDEDHGHWLKASLKKPLTAVSQDISKLNKATTVPTALTQGLLPHCWTDVVFWDSKGILINQVEWNLFPSFKLSLFDWRCSVRTQKQTSSQC